MGEFDEADVLIEDGEIVEVGTGLSASNGEEIDASDHIIVPDSSTRTSTSRRRRSGGSPVTGR